MVELNTVMVYHLGKEIRGRERQTSIEVGAEVYPLAGLWVGDGFTETAPPVAGVEEPFILHAVELLVVEETRDPNPTVA